MSIQSDYLFQSLVLISEDASKVSTKGVVLCIGLMQSDWVAEDLDPSRLGLDILILTRYKRAQR